MAASGTRLDALVVLGCKVTSGQPSAALLRRLNRALVIHKQAPVSLVIMSGGKSWQGTPEAVVMAQWWEKSAAKADGACKILLEDQSRTTRENARYVSVLLERLQLSQVGLVTCDYHMRRATWLFGLRGVRVTPFPAIASRSLSERARLALRETAACWLNRCQGGLS